MSTGSSVAEAADGAKPATRRVPPVAAGAVVSVGAAVVSVPPPAVVSVAAPVVPGAAVVEVDSLSSPQAAMTAPIAGSESPTTVPRRMKPRRDKRPATNSSIT